MYYLNSLTDFKLYKNIEVLSVKKDKDTKNGNVIINIGNKEEDIITLMNSGLFRKNNFRAYYTPKRLESQNKRKKVIINQNEVYKNINTKSKSVSYFRPTLNAYNKRNLYVDLFTEFELNENSLNSKGIDRIERFLSFVNVKLSSLKEYRNKVLVLNVDDVNINEDYFKLTGKNTPLSYFYNAIKRNVLLNHDLMNNNVTVIIFTKASNTFIKFDLTKENVEKSKKLILRRIDNLVDLSTGKLVEDEATDGREELQRDPKIQRAININDKANEVVNSIKASLNIPVDSIGSNEYEIKLIEKITDSIEKDIDDNDLEYKDENDILTQLNNNLELKTYINDLKDAKKNGNRKKITESELRNKQDVVLLGNISIKEIIEDYKTHSIETEEIKTNVLNEEIKKCSLKDFDKSYMEKQFEQDLTSVLTSFNNDMDVKLFVTNVQKENTSTDLTKKFTYTVSLEDEFKVKHTFKVDVPIIKEGRFIQVNGGKKLIMKQLMLLPVVKTKPDTVQITTNYNKFFVTRFGSKKSNKLRYLNKLFELDLKQHTDSSANFKYKNGNCNTINSSYDITMEYSDMSTYLLNLHIDDLHLIFDQSEIEEMFNHNSTKFINQLASIEYSKQEFMIAGYTSKPYRLVGIRFDDKTVHFIADKKTEFASDSISALVLTNMNSILKTSAHDEMSKFKSTNSLSYTRVEINNRSVPLILLLGYELGLSRVLNDYGIKYEFTEANKRIDVTSDTGKIKFKDGYLYYDVSKLRNSLLISGLNIIDTQNYSISDMDDKEVYLSAFYNISGSRNDGKGFHNTLSLMIDPITLDVLKSLKLPENIYDILLYANTLLEDLTFTKLNDMNAYRIRGAEQVNGMMYKIFADSFKTYKDTLKAGNPIKVSVPQDILTKKLLELATVDEYSVLNPSLNF